MTNFTDHHNKRTCDWMETNKLAPFESKVNIQERVNLHFSPLTDTIEGYPRNYCIVFDFSSSGYFNNFRSYWGDYNDRISLVERNTAILKLPLNDDDLYQPMFIGIVDISKDRQSVVSCPVWL